MRRLWRVIRNVVLLALVFAAGAIGVFTLTERGRENLAGIASSLTAIPPLESLAEKSAFTVW